MTNYLRKRINNFKDLSITEDLLAETYKLQDTRDWKLGSTRTFSCSSNPEWETYFTQCLYRPFDSRAYFHHEDVVELPRHEVMNHMVQGSNIGLLVNRQIRLDPSTTFLDYGELTYRIFMF